MIPPLDWSKPILLHKKVQLWHKNSVIFYMKDKYTRQYSTFAMYGINLHVWRKFVEISFAIRLNIISVIYWQILVRINWN